nr:helix-turn-helix domain-containing protein [Hafnia alvei]
MRDSFPSDWVIQCALETGMYLRWIAFGAGPEQDVGDIDVSTLPKSKLINGKLQEDGFYLFDSLFFLKNCRTLSLLLSRMQSISVNASLKMFGW